MANPGTRCRTGRDGIRLRSLMLSAVSESLARDVTPRLFLCPTRTREPTNVERALCHCATLQKNASTVILSQIMFVTAGTGIFGTVGYKDYNIRVAEGMFGTAENVFLIIIAMFRIFPWLPYSTTMF